MARIRLLLALAPLCALALVGVPSASAMSGADRAKAIQAQWTANGWGTGGSKLSCNSHRALCTEVADPGSIWGNGYVGHDEPAVLFYSSRPGSGSHMTYQLTLPREPPGRYSDYKSYNFQLHPAFWFGMALCDTYSYPQTNRSCPAASDRNAVDVRYNSRHPGSAYLELQFYPPGWIPEFAGSSCDPTKWCAALVIWSLSENPIAGTQLNQACQNKILGGIEYGNYAYLTRNGQPQGPPNPLEFDPTASGVPGPTVLYMNGGDRVTVSIHDSFSGLVTKIVDHTTHQTGFMTASAANGFGHIVPAPSGSSCNVQYYNFHPMYSTSQPKTTVPWAAAQYNVAFSDEIGHFDFCTFIDPNSGNCAGQEGPPWDREAADGDDSGCFFAQEALRYPATGCTGTNDPGFDGQAYQRVWPNGNPANRPTPILFTSPLTGGHRYGRVAFNVNLARIEAADLGGTCDRNTGTGCSNPPISDDGTPVAFYPYYSTVTGPGGGCWWGLGSRLARTRNDFGGSSKTEFRHLIAAWYYVFNGGGAVQRRYNDYQRTLNYNPC